MNEISRTQRARSARPNAKTSISRRKSIALRAGFQSGAAKIWRHIGAMGRIRHIKRTGAADKTLVSLGEPAGIRTRDLLIKSGSK